MNTKQISRWLSVALLSCLALFLIVTESPAADEPKEQKPVPIQWRTDYNLARKEAEAKKRPLVIFFYRQDCPCSGRLIRKIVDHRAFSVFLNEKAVPLILEGPTETELVKALNIKFFPTTIIAVPDGRIVESLIGYQEPENLLESVKKATRK
ncbi:MAG: hypothetical protein EXS16_10990 [Gemmataceae bacterium]|nr:hypothetical protein [Gemmataceae bacterium]